MSVDLSTRYLGLKLTNPIVVSSCPLTGELDVLRRLEELGAAAAVLPSLFEEQLECKHPGFAAPGGSMMMESAAYYHELKEYNRGPQSYLKHIAAAKKAVSIPIIGSLNVTSPGDWIRYARHIEEAGADALELNAYLLVTDCNVTSSQVEARYIELVEAVHAEITIPLAVKLGPYFTSLPNVARRCVAAGAAGLVLFNRFLQPDVDLHTLSVHPRLVLSSPEEIRTALRFIAILRGQIDASLAATSGVHFSDDAVRLILAGADVVMVASTLYRHGIEALQKLIEGVAGWMVAKDYRSLDQIKGTLRFGGGPERAAFARANYTKAISAYASGSDMARPLHGWGV